MKEKEEKMEKIDVFNQYQIYIGSGLLNDLSQLIDIKNFSQVIVIADRNISDKILSQFKKIVIDSSEKNKTIESVEEIWLQLLKVGCDRKTLVINLGGGVLGDMGGFAASTFMRGVKFLQAPTTLLSAVDASIGGKVGIDFAGIKNLIGSFNQPIGVVIDVDTFDSLPSREFISGFGEIIKHGIIADRDYFEKVTSKQPQEFSKDELIQIIKKSCEIKANIISEDEKESGNRKLLNFGHTIGHAIESYSLQTEKPLLHGEAVSIGMIAEAKISVMSNLFEEKDLEIIINVLQNAGLPTKYKVQDLEKIIELISKDKKSENGSIKWTLIKSIGEAVINKEVDEEKVRSAVKYISQ